VFLDTNVVASAFLTRGLCADVLLLVIEEHELLTAEIVLNELRTVFRRKFGVATEIISQIETFLRQYHVEPIPKQLPNLPLSDRNDLLVIASALKSGADIVVTGDGEMLRLQNKPLAVVSPREFWTLTAGGKKR
jgi:uncharacterized protein